MDTSLIISVFSAVIALGSALISGLSFYINTTHRHLKDNPFFIFDSTTFESQYSNDIFVNTIFYNFIIASSDKEHLNNIRDESAKEFRKKVDITKEKTYLKLYNAGGIGKNLIVQTTVNVPVHQLETSKTYKSDYWDIKFEGENDDDFGEYSLFTSHRQNESGSRIYFDSEYTTESPYKGITADGCINIPIPKEFILFTNLYIERITDKPPKLKINVRGNNVYNKKFDDLIELAIERYKVTDGDKGRFISVGIRGINKS